MKFNYKNSCQINEEEILKASERALPYLEHLRTVAQISSYDFPESSIILPFDGDVARDVLRIKDEKVGKDLKYIILIGIGGSNLGAKAVYDALHGYFDILEPDRYPKIIFTDTNDFEFLSRLEKFLENKIREPKEILINIISESGKTLETMVNMEFIMGILEKRFTNAKERVVVISHPNSNLIKDAQDKNISSLSVPEKIGGRFSVFSAAGLFPLCVAGIDIEKFIDGAKEARDRCISEEILENTAILSAIINFLNFKNGKIITDSFIFHTELESLGKWYRQLLAESIGKEKDINNKKVNTGITPTVSIGSTDLHSVAQLYLGGPRDKFTYFLWSNNKNFSSRIYDTMEAIYNGVKIIYNKKKLPFVEIILSEISAYTLGQFMQFKMTETMFLGNLFNINTFNQPNIDDYKKEVEQLLK
ncbi:MAG: hypothetical protein AAB491_02985 [Patescibacteria group bacterium]